MISCKNCEFFNKEDCKDALCMGYCPNYEDEDYMSAVCREIEEQNLSYLMKDIKR